MAGTVGPFALGSVTALVTTGGALTLVCVGGNGYAAPGVVGAALVASWALTHRTTRRLGGVTGDVIGAAVETSLAAALVAGSILVSVV